MAGPLMSRDVSSHPKVRLFVDDVWYYNMLGIEKAEFYY